MKKMFIVSSLLALFLANSAVFAAEDEQSLSGANLSSNGAKNPFSATPMDNSGQPQPDTAGQTADDSDSW